MNNSFYSHAFSFCSSAARGVDPRTGLFNPVTPIARLVGNANMGPSFDITLGYSALLDENMGFGTGFSLKYSMYDTGQKRLTVSTGEVYIVDEDASGVWLRQQGLANFRFERLPNAYKITHKSGDIELLSGPDTADTIKVPYAIYTPAGHVLKFSWSYDPGPQLSRVSDESTDLLRINYDDAASTVLHIWPDKQEAYDVTLRLSNGNLTTIETLPDETALSWSFEYEQVDSYYLLSCMRAPTGLVETASYTARLKFPDSAHLSPLPAVARYVQDPGQGQPAVVVTYEYTPENYLGYGADAAWHPDADYLYGILTDYQYQSVETTQSDTAVITVTRTYDSFHLLVAQVERQASCEKTTRTTYYAIADAPFDQQPKQFQLPRQIDTVYTDYAKPAGAQSRTETVATLFDSAGNPLQLIMPDGTQVDWVYYPAQGSADDCPPDPNGFVRFTQSRTLTPGASGFDTPIRTEHFRYRSMLPAQLAGAPIASLVVLTQESHTCDGAPIVDKTTEYVDAPTSSEHGRIKRITSSVHDLNGTGDTYSSSLAFDFTVDTASDALWQLTSFSGHDGLSASITRSQSCFSGRLWSESDVHGNQTAYTYDACGRMLSRTRNPGTEFENTTRFVHERTLDSATGQLSVTTTTTDASGNALRAEVDGFGRAVRRLANDIDELDSGPRHAANWYEIDSKQYDAFGHSIAGMSRDYLRGANGAAAQTAVQDEAAIRYDAWGQRSETSWSDGRTLLESHAPVELTLSTQVQGPADAGPPDRVTLGKRVTQYDLRSLPLSQTDYDANGIAQSTIAQQYDGAGRLREHIDELGRVTQYAYDPFDRIKTITLPDNTAISRTYAPFSADALIASVSVTDAQNKTTTLGSQTFDSLKRLSQSSSGGRKYSYRYDGVTSRPQTITTPANETITSRYVAQLDDALEQRSAGSLTQSFTYDRVTGAMLTATEDNAPTCEWRYAASGTLSAETSTLNDDSKKSAAYAGSLRGRLQQVTDVSARLQTYRYDELGRNVGIDHPAVQVATTYDAVGRVVGYTTLDTATGMRLQTRLTLDDFSREIRREYLQDETQVLDIAQEWNPNWQLRRRVTRSNDTVLRDESFAYDCRNRLVEYSCAGTALNADPYGKPIAEQSFSYDALNNLTTCVTVFSDAGNGTGNENDTATFHYDNAQDPTQLTSVTHTHGAYPATVTLLYDANGRMITDDAGRTLSYDVGGRLRKANAAATATASTSYGYDALNRLVAQALSESESSELCYRDGRLVNDLRTAPDAQAAIIRLGRSCVALVDESAALQPSDVDSTLTRVGVDAAGSAQLSIDSRDAMSLMSYLPYGDGIASRTVGLPGFMGERLDPVTNLYHLGDGYRVYNPRLMRFVSPDALSPFGAGGLNAYAYCAGDPVNRADPSGHMSWQASIGIASGIMGILLAIFSAGVSIAVEGSVLAAIEATSGLDLVGGAVGVLADATGIASAALEQTDEQASEALGWESFAFGLISGGVELTDKASHRIKKLKSQKVADVSPRTAASSPSGARSGLHSDNANSVLRQRTSVSSLDSNRPSTTGFSSASSDDLQLGQTARRYTDEASGRPTRREAWAASSPDTGGNRADRVRRFSESGSSTWSQSSTNSPWDGDISDDCVSIVGSHPGVHLLPLIHPSRATGRYRREIEIPGIPDSPGIA
ncbi:RHS repeat-associated core domain-containing protein [Paraburkholderia sp. BCC1884]|uniref:RHS repeat-associated core domain-containing protein n=1 Tax=Paraburkholderia sp. BCC1884 TaxID=2562668 RepID=UPI0011842CA3|nr:RHS repeat-associated core domain-containing protein [Paraburkholderia sp. BCC1884]